MDHKLEDRTKTVIVEVLFKYGLLKKKTEREVKFI